MPDIRRLVWDAWNVDHIARHQVTREEVEEEALPGACYPVTARSASRKERRLYREERGGGAI